LVWRLGSCRPFNADVDLQLQAQLPLPKNTDAAFQHKDALMELPPWIPRSTPEDGTGKIGHTENFVCGRVELLESV
jgi:hypothetical protein